MRKILSQDQITRTCKDMLRTHRRVTVRQVAQELRTRYGASGKNARIAKALRDLTKLTSLSELLTDSDTAQETAAKLYAAQELIAKLQERVSIAEDREQSHQDLWARRFSERADEYDKKYAALMRARERELSEMRLKYYKQISDLTRENQDLKTRLYEQGMAPTAISE